MKTRTQLQTLYATRTGHPAEGAIDLFAYNLPPDGSCHIDGCIAVFDHSLECLDASGIAFTLRTDEVEQFRLSQGVGCVFLEYVRKDGEEGILCRADMELKLLFAAVVKRLNAHLEGAAYRADYDARVRRICEKCGRPLPSGSDICPRCAAKSGYFKRLWKIAYPYRFYIYFSIFLFICTSVLSLVSPYLSRILVDSYIQADGPVALSGFIFIIGMLFAVRLLTRLISTLRSVLTVVSGNKIVVILRDMVFAKIQSLSLRRITERTSGELINRVNEDTQTLRQFITQEFGNICEQLLMLIAVTVYILVYDFRLGLLILLPVPFVMVSHRLIWRFLRRHYNKQWVVGSRCSSILHDIFSGIRVVKSFGMEADEIERFDRVSYDECKIRSFNERSYALLTPITSFLMTFGEFFLLFYVGNHILNGTMTYGEMSQFSAYVTMIYSPLQWMSGLPRRLIRVTTSMVKVFEIIDEVPDVSDAEEPVRTEITGQISFSHVRFGYDEAVNVLRDVSFDARPGDMIGIVGKSGAGKSTLINLLMRLYDVDEGEIDIDGVDIRRLSQQTLRSHMGVVLQETFLFSGTVLANIAYAKPDATREQIIRAAKLAGAHGFIMKLPDGYNTYVGERGYTLSGGERQRVAIARALLHDPRILILDEATASLDTETEKQIQDALANLTRGRTTIAIAHRLSTLRNATRLIVLDHGVVAECGTHLELMQQKGIYYGLVMAQRQMTRMPKN